MAKWYYSAGDRAQGPVDEAVILENIRSGQLTLVDLVYREGDKAWHTVGEIPEFSAAATQPQAVEAVEAALPPAISSNGPFRFEGGVTLTWVLLQKKSEGDHDRYDQSGPFSAEELEAQLSAGTAKYSDYVWRPGYRRWTRLGNLPEFDRRRKTRDGDKTPDLVPLPDIEEVDFPRESRELLSAVVQAAPPSLASLSVPEDPPAEAAGRDLAENTAAQFYESDTPTPTPTPTSSDVDFSIKHPSFEPPPLKEDRDATPVPKLSDVSMPGSQAKHESEDFEATIVQSSAMRSSGSARISMDSDATIVHLPSESDSEEIELEEMASRFNWKKPALIGVGAVVLGAVGFVIVQKFSPGLFEKLKGDREEMVDSQFVDKPASPRQEVKVAEQAPPKPVEVPAPAAPSIGQKPQQQRAEPVPQVAAAAPPVTQPNPEEIKVPVKAVAAGPKATVLEIVAVRTDTQKPQFAVNTDAPVGATVWLTVSARSGEVLKFPSFYRSTSVMRGPGQIPTFDLTSWKLPAGQYRLDAFAGDVRTSRTVFIGKKDAAFAAEMEKHLKYISYQQQEEKKALFHSARELERLAKNLGDSYFKLKSDVRGWRAFYFDWQKQIKRARQISLDRARIEKRNEMTYPDEIFALKSATDRLTDQARSLNDSIMSNTPARDVAATSQLAIVREFTKLRAQMALISSRR